LLGGPVRSNLIISVLPSIGVRWLNRRLSEFLKSYPDVRLDLPIGPVRIDYGFPTQKDQWSSGGGKFNFNIGYQF